MIKQEQVTIDNREFIHTYSDEGRDLLQVDTGIVYEDVLDLVEYPHEYEETGEPKQISDSEALAIITAGEYGNGGGLNE